MGQEVNSLRRFLEEDRKEIAEMRREQQEILSLEVSIYLSVCLGFLSTEQILFVIYLEDRTEIPLGWLGEYVYNVRYHIIDLSILSIFLSRLAARVCTSI